MNEFIVPLSYAGVVLLCYFLGSIPFGLLFTGMAGLGDVRHIGSGNIGATNVLRTGRKDIAALTLLCDALKGTAAFTLGVMASFINLGFWNLFLACFAVFIGHLFPVWLKFKGGKGVATYLGLLIGIDIFSVGLTFSTFVFAAVWLCTAAFTRYSSAAALASAILTPLFIYFTIDTELGILFGCLSLLLIFKHAANITRLFNGTESRIGASS